jgi:hypothetical protein
MAHYDATVLFREASNFHLLVPQYVHYFVHDLQMNFRIYGTYFRPICCAMPDQAMYHETLSKRFLIFLFNLTFS